MANQEPFQPGTFSLSFEPKQKQGLLRRGICATALLPWIFAGPVSSLVSSDALANIVGTDVQNFNPTSDGLDFVTVQSSQTLEPGVINFGAFWNDAFDTLPVYGGQSSSYSDSLMSSDLNVAVGILRHWELGVSLPAVLEQSLNDSSGAGLSFSSTGFTEIKLNTKYRVWNDDDQGVAVVLSTNFSLITNDPFVGVPAHPGLNLELVYDRHFGPVTWALNVGHRWRDPGAPIPNIPILPIHNQWIASTAANYLFKSWDTKLIAEIYGAMPVSHSADVNDRQQSSLEGLLGLKHDFTSSLAGHAGVGRELIHGIASPDFRVYAGVSYAMGPVFGRTPTLETVHVAKPEVSEDEVVQPGDHFIANNLNFKFNSTELESDSKQVLDELVEHLKQAPFRKLVIEGHTDSVGRASYNQALSEFRSQAIRKRLIDDYGLAPNQIAAVGYGASRPIADNGNYQGRLKNRRVEFKIIR